MPRSQRPRKKYRPTAYRLPSTIRYSAEDETRLQLVPHISLDLFRSGNATEGDWHTLACRINWGVVLATRHHQDALEVAQDGVRALRDVFDRHQRTGRWGCSGEDLKRLGDALVLVDDMQQAHTRKELLDALNVALRVAGREDSVGAVMEVPA